MQFPAMIELSALAGSDGFVAHGITTGHTSGASVSAAGDVNGDSIDDLIIGAPRASPNSTLSGAAYVVFGRSDGFDAIVELSALGSGGFAIEGAIQGGSAGSAVTAADVNGDGIDDLIVAAYRAAPDAVLQGATYVIFGRSDGFDPTIELSALGDGGFVIEGASAQDLSGNSVGAGDVNGDGIEDLIIGASGAGRSGYDTVLFGASFVVFGRTDGFAPVLELSTLGDAGFVIWSVAAGQGLGRSVSGAGDVNGDGIDDVIVGAPGADPNGARSGASYVVFGRTSGFGGALELSSLGDAGFVIEGAAAEDGSGYAVSGAGDVNGDGIDDVIVGARRAGPNGAYSGAAYVVFGRTGGFAGAVELSALGSGGFVIEGAAAGDSAGIAVSGAGDLDGDGIDDLVVGAIGASPNGTFSGASYVIFGRTSGFGGTVELSALGSLGFVVNGASAGDVSGDALSRGDVNGDGTDDLIVGARTADPHGDGSGATYVIFGRPPPPPDTTPPGAPAVAAVADDTGTPGDGVTTDRTLIVSGTAEPLSIVRVFRGATLVDDTTADANGNWSLADPAMLAFGAHLYRAEAEDAAGNVSARSAPLEVFVVNPAALPSGGNDLVLGTAGANQIQGGAGNDTVFGEDGNDTLKGNDGNDWLFGGEGSDRLDGENGADVLRGGNGNDTVYGQNGKDTIRGDNGSDRLEGGADADSIDGGLGADTVYGGIGTDTLVGGAGGDRLYGDADPDWIDLSDDTSRDTVFGTIAHLADDTIDGFVDGVPTVPGADMVFVSGMTNAQRKTIDGDILDAEGRLFLPGGTLTFAGHAGAEVDAVLVSGGVQIWLV